MSCLFTRSAQNERTLSGTSRLVCMKPTVAIAGASGFIGRWFMHRYRDHYRFIALSRKKMKPSPPDSAIEWRQVDLYSLSGAQEALQGAHYAIYLVHSMRPSTRLNQGSFDNTDILLADNFVRGAEANGVRQIVFLSGILPEKPGDSSRPLRSRQEVERTLKSTAVPLTALRAGIIVGPGGTSFKVIERLVDRLPLMLCPKWSLSETQPIGLDDTLALIHEVLGNPSHYDADYDIGGEKVTTYFDMLKTLARLKGKRRWIYALPFDLPGLSRLWVAFFSGLSPTMVSPLIETLRWDLRVSPNPLMDDYEPRHSFEEAAQVAIAKGGEVPELPILDAPPDRKEKNTVRSVQRLPNPGDRSATWVARRYQTWLPRLFRYVLKVEQRGETSVFRIGPLELLHLKFIPSRSDADRQLFYIVGGRLVKRRDHGWLEFRRVLGGTYFISAIHEFVPTLPWVVYNLSQALAHLWVMHRFGRYLESLEE